MVENGQSPMDDGSAVDRGKIGLALVIILGACLLAALAGTGWLLLRYPLSFTAIVIALIWCACVLLIWPMMRSANPHKYLLLGCLVAVILRCAMIFVVDGASPIAGDPKAYSDIASSLLRGEGYFWRSGGPLGDLKASMPPLYPLSLTAMLFLTGKASITIPALNFLCDLASAALIYAAVRHWRPGQHALAAAYLYLVWPRLVIGTPIANKESLATLLVIALAYVTIKLYGQDRPRIYLAATFGFLSAALALTQPGWIFLPVMFALIAASRIGFAASVRLGSIAFIVAVATMLPWWIRNWQELHAFVPLTTSSGLNFYTNTMRSWDMPAEAYRLSETERLPYLFGLATEWIANHPVEFLLERLKAAILALSLEHAQVEGLAALSGPPRLPPEAFGLTLQLSLLVMWAGPLWVVVKGLPKKQDVLAFIVLACFLHLAAINLWFEFGQRHRVFLLPILIVLSFAAFQSRLARHDRHEGR